jgi:hypothetical protein
MNLDRTAKEIEKEYTRIYREIPDSDDEWVEYETEEYDPSIATSCPSTLGLPQDIITGLDERARLSYTISIATPPPVDADDDDDEEEDEGEGEDEDGHSTNVVRRNTV